MYTCEDFFYEIYQDVSDRGISDEFYKQLDKMKFQDKHKHKTVKEQWEYAYEKLNIGKSSRYNSI